MNSSFVRATGALSAFAFAALPAVADPTFEFYGQLNFGLFHTDDGTESETYFTDNDNSNTRVGFRYSNSLAAGGSVRFNLETALGFQGSSSVTMDDTDLDIDLKRTDLRKLEVSYVTPSWGTFWLGQGSMSADGVTQADFSRTTVVSDVQVRDLARSFQFRPDGGALSGTSIGNTFNSFDGSRRLRLRYDTPEFAGGFMGSISYGEEELNRDDDREFTDIALTYKHDYGDIQADGRLGYQWIDDDEGTDEEILAGSFALLHKPSGVSFALAAGDPKENDASYWYTKLGYQQKWFSIGGTALSIDYYDGSDFRGEGADSKSWAVAAVQRVDDYNLELFAAYRVYDYDASGTDFEDIDVLTIGARWRF